MHTMQEEGKKKTVVIETWIVMGMEVTVDKHAP